MYDGSIGKRGIRRAPAAERRWEIAELAIECRSRIVASVLRGYPKVSRDRIEELYDKVWERATQPAGEPAAFPEPTYEKLEPWLRSALIGELRHEVTDRHSHTKRVGDPIVLDLQVDHNADPAGAVERRQEFDELMRSASESLTERTRTYIGMTRIGGLSRAEFRARTGWNQKRIQRARKEWAEFAARVRSGAAALAPVVWLKRLFAAGGGDVTGAGGGMLGGKAVLATCGAAAVCAGGAVGIVEVQHRISDLQHREPRHARVVKSAVEPEAQSRQTAAEPSVGDERVRARAAEQRRARAARRADKRERVEREFGPQSIPTDSSGGSGAGASGGDGSTVKGSPDTGSSNSSFSSEFAP